MFYQIVLICNEYCTLQFTERLIDPQILLSSMKSIDLNENIGFKSTVFWCLFLKTWCFSGAFYGIILSGYFYAAKCCCLFSSSPFEKLIHWISYDKKKLKNQSGPPCAVGLRLRRGSASAEGDEFLFSYPPQRILFTFFDQAKKVKGFSFAEKVGQGPIKKR